MELVKIYTDTNFSNAEIPEGQILTYIGTDENGKVVTRYKDNQGNTGTIAGSGGVDTSDATVTAEKLLEGVTAYGASGKVIGTIPTASAYTTGNKVIVSKGHIPENKEFSIGSAKGAETFTPGIFAVTIPEDTYLTGDQVIKGDFNLAAENIKTGISIFDVEGSFTSDSDATAGDIATGKTAYVKGEKVTGNLDISYYKCAFVDTEENTWKGYKAILSNGVYHFSDVLSVLSYGEGFTPSVNGIYDKKALVQVKSLYQGVDQTLVFHAPLQSESTTAETGQTMAVSGNVEYRNVENRDCAYFDGDSKLVITDVSALPFGSAQHTICGWFRYSEFSQFIGLLGYGYEYAIRANSDYGVCDVVYYSNTGGAFEYQLEADRWYHIATTWDGTTIRLYIDGVMTSTNSEAPSFYQSESNPLWIGGVPRTGTAHGYVSDVRIYTRALSDEEIAAVAAS